VLSPKLLAERDESDIENQTPKAPATPPPPPNGGLVAWLQVAGAFILFFNCWSVPKPSTYSWQED
jgi:hypothetical protein